MRRWVGVDLKIFSSDPLLLLFLLLLLAPSNSTHLPSVQTKRGEFDGRREGGGENECREEEEEAKKGERQTRTPFSHLEI